MAAAVNAPVGAQLVARPDLAVELGQLADRAQSYAAAGHAAATRRSYATAWDDFAGWCAQRGLAALPAVPEAVALYLADRAQTLVVSTLEWRLVAIGHAHRAAMFDDPADAAVVKAVWRASAAPTAPGRRARRRCWSASCAPPCPACTTTGCWCAATGRCC